MAIGLTYEFTYRAMLKPPVDAGAGPLGQRIIFEVVGGDAVEGERINGRVMTGGGDWILVGPDGFGRIDVRAQIETHDGAVIYMQYFGLLEFNEALNTAMQTGSATDWDDQYFRTAPRLETGDERYAWVNTTLFVAEGHALADTGVEYRVYRVD
jgi:Protein of unknown function (DUF3237)